MNARATQNMKGLILSGGKGTRMRPLTYTSAKQLIPVANKPVLVYGIEAIVATGIEEIAIILSPETGPEIRECIGDGSRYGATITYIEQDAPRGLAHAVLTAEPFLGTSPFVMYLGDNLLQHGITPLVEEYRSLECNSEILLTKVANPSQFGVAELDGDRVVRLTEKPPEPKSDLALVGVYMFDENIFKAARAIKPSKRGELEITDAIQWLLDNGYSVHPHIVKGWWKDTGKIEDMLEANRTVLDTFENEVHGKVTGESHIEGKVVVEEGAQIIDSVVRGPAIIGRDARIAHAYVGPYTSIGNRCAIEYCEIENSIVLEGSAITYVDGRIEASLIGKNVKIGKTHRKPAAYRFILGDNSEVGIT
jgi:glucose-1-phosphate thymidylyltransferase